MDRLSDFADPWEERFVGEWQYEHVEPRLLVERLVQPVPDDYKVVVFRGGCATSPEPLAPYTRCRPDETTTVVGAVEPPQHEASRDPRAIPPRRGTGRGRALCRPQPEPALPTSPTQQSPARNRSTVSCERPIAS